MEQSNKYYTPTIEEFHVGFEYEYYGNGSEETEEADRLPNTWIKDVWAGKPPDCLADVGFYYSYFKDAKLRVKYLDKEDIESLGFKTWDEKHIPGKPMSGKYSKFTDASSIGGTNGEGKLYGATIFYGNIVDPTFIRIEGAVAPGSVFGYIGGEPLFKGKIKNKSELVRLLKQLGIYEEENPSEKEHSELPNGGFQGGA